RISERTGTSYRPPSSSPERTVLAAQLEDRELKTLRTALGVRDVPAQTYADRMVVSRPLTAREPDPLPYAAASTPSTARFGGPEEGVTAPGPPQPTAVGWADRTIPEPPAVVTADAPGVPAQPARVAAEQSQPAVPTGAPIADILLGATEMTPQYGVLGKA